MYASLNRILVTATGIALLATGCFNNVSSTTSKTASKSQSNGPTLDDTGFANETGVLTTNAVLIGTYRDSSNSNDYGILIDLKRSLTNTLGAAAVQQIQDTIDSNTSMQSRSVVIQIPQFGIKATTTLGKIAAGNNKRIRNIMNIRPRIVRVDLTTSSLDVPESPAVLQLRNSNRTVVTYGGKIEGDFVRRMMVLIPFAGSNGSFLPSPAVPTYGDGYPSAAPEEAQGSVKLVRVTPEIQSLFSRILTSPPYGSNISSSIQSDAIKQIAQTRDSLGLSVHYKVVNGIVTSTIDAAYFVNINPANMSGPETFPFCHSGYDNQFQYIQYGAGSEIEYDHPLACACEPYGAPITTVAGDPASPPATTFVDPCPTSVAQRKPALIAAAVAANNPAPTTGFLIPPMGPVSDFLFQAL